MTGVQICIDLLVTQYFLPPKCKKLYILIHQIAQLCNQLLWL